MRQKAKYSSSVGGWSKKGWWRLERFRLAHPSTGGSSSSLISAPPRGWTNAAPVSTTAISIITKLHESRKTRSRGREPKQDAGSEAIGGCSSRRGVGPWGEWRGVCLIYRREKGAKVRHAKRQSRAEPESNWADAEPNSPNDVGMWNNPWTTPNQARLEPKAAKGKRSKRRLVEGTKNSKRRKSQSKAKQGVKSGCVKLGAANKSRQRSRVRGRVRSRRGDRLRVWFGCFRIAGKFGWWLRELGRWPGMTRDGEES